MGDKCKWCDRSECSSGKVHHSAACMVDGNPPYMKRDICAACAAMGDCAAHAVDWRARCRELQFFIEGEAARTADARKATEQEATEEIAAWLERELGGGGLLSRYGVEDIVKNVRAGRWKERG